MKTYQDIEKDELKDLLNANWMTHDAVWFGECLKEFGIQKTNSINRKAVREMAKVEAKRIRKLLGIRKVETIQELKNFFDAGFSIIKGAFMKFEMNFNEDGVLLWKVPRCFAHDGIKKIGAISEYECGIVERVFGWMDALEVRYEITPKPNGCNLYKLGKCEMEIRFSLEFENS